MNTPYLDIKLPRVGLVGGKPKDATYMLQINKRAADLRTADRPEPDRLEKDERQMNLPGVK